MSLFTEFDRNLQFSEGKIESYTKFLLEKYAVDGFDIKTSVVTEENEKELLVEDL